FGAVPSDTRGRGRGVRCDGPAADGEEGKRAGRIKEASRRVGGTGVLRGSVWNTIEHLQQHQLVRHPREGIPEPPDPPTDAKFGGFTGWSVPAHMTVTRRVSSSA